jgi:hypothetical protein
VRLSTGATRTHRTLAVIGGLVLMTSSWVAVAGTAQAGGDAATLVSLTNGARAERGLSRYATSSELASVAQRWAQKLASRGNLAHNPALSSQVGNYDYVGENVGYGANAAQIHGALMNSAPHKANILDRDYTQIGIGTARDAKGALWIAEVFRDPAGSSAAKPKPSAAPKPRTTPKATAKPVARKSQVRTTSSSGNVAAPKPAARPAKPAPKKVVTPAPPTLAEKLEQVQQWAQASNSGDPLVSTMMFTRAMDTLAS